MLGMRKKENGTNTAGGIGAGAIFGAMIGGPLGAFFGGVIGGLIGYATEKQV